MAIIIFLTKNYTNKLIFNLQIKHFIRALYVSKRIAVERGHLRKQKRNFMDLEKRTFQLEHACATTVNAKL